MIIEARCEQDTYELGKKLGEEAKPGQVYALIGDLGVGKTIFTKGFASSLGIEEAVTSPTFNIIKEYTSGEMDLYHMDVETLGIYISLLANFRNICAHEDILYDYRTQRVIPDNKYHEILNIDKTDDEYIYGKNDLFALLIMLKQMLSEDEFHDLLGEISYEVDYLDGIVDVVPLNNILNRLGFPDNWRDIEQID